MSSFYIYIYYNITATFYTHFLIICIYFFILNTNFTLFCLFVNLVIFSWFCVVYLNEFTFIKLKQYLNLIFLFLCVYLCLDNFFL